MEAKIDISKYLNKFGREEECYNFLFNVRWPSGFACPKCNHDKYWNLESRNLLQCANCKNQISLSSGTIFHGTKMPLQTWFLMIFLLVRENIPIANIKELLNIKSYETAWSMAKKIKEGVKNPLENSLINSICACFEECTPQQAPDSNEDIINEFIRVKKEAGLDAKSAVQYNQNLKKISLYVKKRKLKLLDLTENDLVEYLDHLKKEGFTLTSINQHITTIRGFFLFLEKKVNIQNPSLRLKIFKVERLERTDDREKIEQFYSALLVDSSINSLYRLILILMIKYGINGATICSLRMKDVVFISNKFTIQLPQKKVVVIDESSKEIYPAVFDYYNNRVKIDSAYDNFFLSSQESPFTRPHIIYMLKISAKKFHFENISLVSLSGLSSSDDKFKRGSIINERYKILFLLEKKDEQLVYKVIDLKDKNSSKILKLHLIDNVEANKEKLNNYFALITKAGHQHIAKILDFGILKNPSGYFTIEEFSSFKTLLDFTKKLGVNEVKKITESLLIATAYLHDNGIGHGDMKPENIIVIKKKKVLLTQLTNFSPLSLGVGSQFDKRKEIFTLGSTLYHLITERWPYEREKSIEVQTNNPIDLHDLAPQYPADFCKIIMQMVTQDKDTRFQDAKDVLLSLKTILTSKYHELKKINIEIPIPKENLKEITNLIKDLQNRDGKQNKYVVTLSESAGSGKDLFINELKNSARIESIQTIHLKCNKNEHALYLYDLLSDEKRDDKCAKFQIENGLYSYFDFDSHERRVAFYEKSLQLIQNKSPLLIIVENIERAETDLFEMLMFIIRGLKTKGIASLVFFTINKDSPNYVGFLNSLEMSIQSKFCYNFELNPFTQKEVDEYVNEYFGEKISINFIEQLFLYTSGSREKIFRLTSALKDKRDVEINAGLDESTDTLFLESLKAGKPIEDYLSQGVDESTIITILACMNQRVPVGLLQSIFYEYKGSAAIQYNDLILNLVNNDYLISSQNGTSRFISLPDGFNNEEYLKNNEIKSTIHKIIANEIIDKNRYSIPSIIELIIHLEKSDNYSMALKYIIYIVEESVANGLLSDALFYTNQAMEFYDKLSKSEVVCLTLWRARILTHLYKLNEATIQFDSVESIIDSTDEKLLFITHKARFLIRIGNLNSALKLLKEAIKSEKINENKKICLHLRMLTASTLIVLLNFHEALNLIEESLKLPLLNSPPEAKLRLKFLNLYAMCRHHQSNHSEAIKILNNVEKEAIENKFIVVAVTSNHDSAVIYYRLLDFEKSILAYKKALALLEGHNDILRKAMTINGLATTYFRVGNFRKALTLYNEAMSIYDIIGRSLGYEELIIGVAWFYFNIGDFENALKLCQKSYDIAKTYENRRIEGYCELLFGKLLKVKGTIKDALEKYDIAIEIFTKQKLTKEVILSKLSKTELLTTIGTFDEAKTQLDSIREKITLADLKAKFLIEEIKLQVESNLYEKKIIEKKLDEIRKSPLFNNDWEIILGFHGVSFLYYHKIGNQESATQEVALLKDKMSKLTKGLDDEKVSHFLNQSEFSQVIFRFDETQDTKISFEKLIDINFKISKILNEEVLFDRIIKYFILLSGTINGAILIKQNDSEFNIVAGKDKNGANIKLNISSDIFDHFSEFIVNEEKQSRRTGVSPVQPLQNGQARRLSYELFSSNKEKDLPRFIAIPICQDDKIAGFLYGEFGATLKTFDETYLKMLKLFSTQAGISILNAQSHLELKNEIKNLRVEKEELEKRSKDEFEKFKNLDSEFKKASSHIYIQERRTKFHYENIVGKSFKMRELLALVERVAVSDVPVFISGESGTGKELIARAVHKIGLRKNNPFFAENCAAFSETLLESELFGHMRGSYTGAISDQAGIFEIADGGTVFLDEVGDMSLGMQTKLLRVLQEGEIRRIGDRKTRKVNVRVISATNRDLKAMLINGKFREDLFYRLNVFSIKIPSLRERKEDIEDLALYFIDKYGRKEGKTIEIDYEVIEALKKHSWPGNIRELENEIQKLLLLCETDRITETLIADDPKFNVGN